MPDRDTGVTGRKKHRHHGEILIAHRIGDMISWWPAKEIPLDPTPPPAPPLPPVSPFRRFRDRLIDEDRSPEYRKRYGHYKG